VKVVNCASRAEWLEWRNGMGNQYHGASQASVSAGINPYMTAEELYMVLVGLKPREDISEKERVVYGTEAEEPLRRLFELDFADRFKVTTAPYDYLLDERYPFIGATLDGYLEYTADDKWTLESPTGFTGTIYKGDRGVYEGKTALVRTREDFDAWSVQAPDYYLAQGCQQLYVCRKWAHYWFINALVEVPRFRKVDDGFEQLPFGEQKIVRHVYFIDDPVVRESINFVISKVVEMKRRVDLRIPPDTKLS
jgi:hypothetical protein